jgi:hypothetical protein
MGLMVIHYAMTVKRKGLFAVNVRKIKALNVKLNIIDNAGGQSDTGKGR